MAGTVEDSWRAVEETGKQLLASISDSHSAFHDINRALAEYRAICDALVFADFEFAYKNNIELLLWDTHSRVNNKYRKRLSYFRDGAGKKKVVEQRKLMKSYLEFIKSSQRYYRGYIQSLEKHFGGIPELEHVALKFAVDSHSSTNQIEVSSALRKKIFDSCHQTLVRLGDLSRYRETELVNKDRNWGPAIGYYDLANAIHPFSGASHNQLAVIALTDGSHLRSTYHLYRALSVEEPHATARGNLELGFKKIIAAHEKGELISSGPLSDGAESGKALVGWFMLLHAQCYKGVEFPGHDELESEVLSQLVVELKERSLESTLHKIVLVNIAAQFFAGVRLQLNPDSEQCRQSFLFFMRLNVKTMFTLLQVLQPELECLIPNDGPEEDVGVRRSETITAVTRRVLAALRHYSSWLSSNTSLLVAQLGDNALNVQIKELWKIYANTLTLLAATFPTSDLPIIDYLLEEDEDTIGFKPFQDENTRRRYLDQETNTRKPRSQADGVERQHPNLEMLGRIRDLLTDGLTLVLDKAIPVDLLEGTTRFAYHEEGMPSEAMTSPEGHHPTLSSTSIELSDIAAKNATARDAASCIGDELTASISISANPQMNAMVDQIVGSETTNESEYQEKPADLAPFRGTQTPPSYSFEDSPIKTNGNETSYGFFGTLTAQEYWNEQHEVPEQATPRPLLPSILNSVFAPTVEEMSPRPGTAKGLSPIRLNQQTPNKHIASSSISSMQVPSSLYMENVSPLAQNDRFYGMNGLAIQQTSYGGSYVDAASPIMEHRQFTGFAKSGYNNLPYIPYTHQHQFPP